jgi:hypothetical protein
VHEISEAYRNTISALNDHALAALFIKSNEGYEKLEPGEKLQVTSYCMVALKLYEEAYYQRQLRRLDEYIWEGMVTQLQDSMSTQTLSAVWKVRRHQFGGEFRAFVDNLAHGQYAL